jgi:4-amino-4-deoxy-L-arabinose transferase-like glycosyltransferase
LTYHEAFVAQGAREILDSANWAHPTIGSLPWLEKPPLPWWLVAVLARYTGGVTETVARFPSVLAAMGVVWGVGVLAARHYGPQIGLLAGAIQATTAWTVIRGRLAEADILLTLLITWAIVAFDQLVPDRTAIQADSPRSVVNRWRAWRWAFFALLGCTGLVKGIGFGAVLVLVVVAGVLLWQRDSVVLHRLNFPAGWAMAGVIAFTWPLFMVTRYGSKAVALWVMHVANRLSGQFGPGSFASEAWWEYIPALVGQALPWSPLALVGAWYSLRRVISSGARVGGHCAGTEVLVAVVAGDRLLWVWAVAPLGLLALAIVKNAHYAISAQVPWSIWAALAGAQLASRFRRRAWNQRALQFAVRTGFLTLALAYGLGWWLLGPWLNRRGLEWAFYQAVGRQIPSSMPLILLYDDWDRNPYESPFGPVPHDLAVRLFYLGRPASWYFGLGSLPVRNRSTFAVIGRDRDLPALAHLGRVEVVAHGPTPRRDRVYAVFRVTREEGDRSANRSRPEGQY